MIRSYHLQPIAFGESFLQFRISIDNLVLRVFFATFRWMEANEIAAGNLEWKTLQMQYAVLWFHRRWWLLLLSLLEIQCSNCVWNCLVFSYLASMSGVVCVICPFADDEKLRNIHVDLALLVWGPTLLSTYSPLPPIASASSMSKLATRL
jgi:hypothetical protein